MGLTNLRLSCGDKSKGVIKSDVNLYEKIEDVQNKAYKVTYNGINYYAKYGELTDSKASPISVKINGVEKALLTTARTIWNFDNVSIRYKEGSASTSSNSANLVGKYSGSTYTDAELQWDVSIPPNAKNVVVKWDWETQNKPIVNLDWFNHTLKLDQSSTTTSGHYEFSIGAGGIWNNSATVSSYDAGVFNKYLYIRNFSIEFDTD